MILARVEHGIWLVDCPCKSAIALAPIGELTDKYDWPANTDVFNCRRCGASNNISWPVERAEIEAILEVRPESNRNWHPYETIADLRIENAAHFKELL